VPAPLATRMRPASLDEFVGQRHLLGPGKPLGEAIRRGTVGSIVLWGPPGSGKTTLAHLVARHTEREFVAFSAVTEGVPRVREIIRDAAQRRALGRGTILFCDEIHRFNRAQQDAFLPHVERGVVTLVGATTENPSFALNAALLSRCQVHVLEPLDRDDLATLVRRALADRERGVGSLDFRLEPDALEALTLASDGDARRALAVLEVLAGHFQPGSRIDAAQVREAMALRVPAYDRAGEEHFNLLSAYHKSLRGSDPQASLYWMARMLEAGEDPLVLCRRAIAMAAEDIGLADPNALQIAVAARDAFQMLGAPEGFLPIAEMTVYLATAAKSNTVKVALDGALDAARATPAAPVPLHLRNAPTRLMKDLGYGRDYVYPHGESDGYADQTYLPADLEAAAFYQPGERGFERRIAERMAWWASLRDRERGRE